MDNDSRAMSPEEMRARIEELEAENSAVQERYATAIGYLRAKIDQLLSVMGTQPLQAKELNDDTLISFDPVGIISDSFVQILGHLHATNEDLRRAKDEIHAIFESTGAGICVLDRNMRVLAYNKRQKEIFFSDRDDVVGMSCNEVTCGSPSSIPVWCTCKLVLESGRSVHQRDLSMCGRHFDVVGTPIQEADGTVERVVLTYTDITNYQRAEQKNRELQAELLQSQKMESLGRLAGGIAHDFNNILTTVIGFSEIALMDAPPGTEFASRIATIREAGEKAASLVNQLLAFSRKQVLDLEIVDLNDVVKRIGSMLARLIGEDVRLVLSPVAGLNNIRADRGQIEQVLVNLVVNARDAMPGGGTVTIRTANVVVDAQEPGQDREREISEGAYVVLTVADTGAGMSREVLDKIFEPFFTTKDVGKGTGLGLATVYGIVRQHGAYITVASTEGEGSSFAVYFPATLVESVPAREIPAAGPPRGTETILLVEDEALTRRMIVDTLKSLDYTVVEAMDGMQALHLAERLENRFDMLLTDVIMPGMNGWELAEILKERKPGLKVLYTSGYPADILSKGGVTRDGIVLLPKPFNRSLLAEKMREVLDGGA